jgi:hypothetical protein
MKTGGLVALWVVSVGAAMAVGVVAVRREGPESGPARAPSVGENRAEESETSSGLLARLEELRQAIAAKESEIGRLREELAAVKSQMRPSLSPELEKQLKKRIEQRAREKADEPWRQRWNSLRTKIVQRKSKALREEGLAELSALLQSTETRDLEMGLGVLAGLSEMKLDKERFRPYVLAAMSDERGSVRRLAAECAGVICSYEEMAEITARTVQDADIEIRLWAAIELSNSSAPEQKRLAIPALRSALEEGDLSARRDLLLWRLYSLPEELDDVVVKLLGEKELESDLKRLFHHGGNTLTRPVVQRLSEMYEKGASEGTILGFLDPRRIDLAWREEAGLPGWEPRLTKDARPVVRDTYLRIVKESLRRGYRSQALEGLRKLGDASVIPYLDEIARSDDAEGIEKELAETIERLRQKESQQR